MAPPEAGILTSLWGEGAGKETLNAVNSSGGDDGLGLSTEDSAPLQVEEVWLYFMALVLGLRNFQGSFLVGSGEVF